MPDALTALVSARPLALTRIVVGVAALIRAGVAWGILAAFDDPRVLRIPVVEGFVAPDSATAQAIVIVWALAAVGFILGWRLPWTGGALAASIVGYLLLDSQTYSNHLYLMGLIVVLLTVGRADSALAVGADEGAIPYWPVLLIRLQVTIVYGFAAITKLNDEFLSGLVLAGTLNGGIVDLPDSLRTPGFLSLVAVAAVATELFVAVFLWSRTFRPWAFLLGGGLHLAITMLIGPFLELLVFSLVMVATYPLFLDRAPVKLVWDDTCDSCADWVGRFRRFDTLALLVPVGAGDPSHGLEASAVAHAMHTVTPSGTRSGFDAVTTVLEHTVPALWVAPALRLPGIRQAGARWYAHQAARRSCSTR